MNIKLDTLETCKDLNLKKKCIMGRLEYLLFCQTVNMFQALSFKARARFRAPSRV